MLCVFWDIRKINDLKILSTRNLRIDCIMFKCVFRVKIICNLKNYGSRGHCPFTLTTIKSVTNRYYISYPIYWVSKFFVKNSWRFFPYYVKIVQVFKTACGSIDNRTAFRLDNFATATRRQCIRCRQQCNIT